MREKGCFLVSFRWRRRLPLGGSRWLRPLAAAAGRNRHRNARLSAHTAAANPVPQRKVLVKNRDLAGLLRYSSLEL